MVVPPVVSHAPASAHLDRSRFQVVVEPGPPVDPMAAQRARSEFDRLTVPGGDLRVALTRLVDLTRVLVPGADAVSVAVGRPGAPAVVASSSTWAQAADGAQLMAEEGPTFEAHASRAPVVTADLGADPRWPHLAVHLRENPYARACSAYPLLDADGPAGVLTLYAHAPDRLLTPAGAAEAQRVADRAVGLFRIFTEHEALIQERAQLRQALTSRAVIDQAKGMIMHEAGCTADEAFARLKRISNLANRKLRDVAQEIVDTAAGARRRR